MDNILCPECQSIASWDSYFQKYMCGTCNWRGIDPKVSQIRQEFELTKLQDVTVNKIQEHYQCGDIREYIDALKCMVNQLVKEKQYLKDKLIREPIQVKIDYNPENDFAIKEFKKKMDDIWK